jgi:hypothetical protein
MHYTLHGRVSTQLCRDCRTYPVFGFLRLYVDAKEIKEQQLVDERGLAAFIGKQVAREEIGKEGDYKISIDDRQNPYQGGPLLAVLEVPYLPPMKGEEQNHPTQFIILGTIHPEWKERDNAGAAFAWSASVNPDLWCRLMALFDVWCICGRVVNCKTQQPAVGVTVKAMDDDWIKDDFLGSDVTDASGYFRICFRSITFKKTFLSPIINVETPLGGDMGPDVYFIVEAGGDVILQEDPSEGQKDGRKNRTNCTCVTLCVELGGGQENDPIRAVWTSVGTYDIPDFLSLHDFDAEGYGGPNKYGFFSVLPLKGELKEKSLAGLPIEYRFMVSHSTLPNAIFGPSVPAASFTPATFANGWFVSLKIGIAIKNDASANTDIVITPADMDGDGWVNIQNAILRTFATDPEGIGITPADWASGDWGFIGNFYMAGLHSGLLTTTHALPAYVKAGVGPNPADYYPIEKIAIRFENREVVAPGIYNPVIGNGKTLNSIVVNNDAPYAIVEAHNQLGIVQYCQEFDLPPKLAYTVYHPHLMSASLHLAQNGGGYSAAQNDAPLPLDNGGVRPGTTSVAGTRVIAPLMTETCIYIASLSYGLRLTTGENYWSGGPATSIFYYHHP